MRRPMTAPKKRVRPPAETEAPPILRFRAAPTRTGSGSVSWTWIDIPERVSQAFAPWMKAGRLRVDATLDGAPVQGSLTPRGGGRHMLVLSASVRREAGVSLDKAIAVTLTPRLTDDVRVPDDLAAALAKAGARDAFEAMASSHRWELVRYVMGARTDATRARYVARAVDHALGRAAPAARSAQRGARGWHCPACGKRFSQADAEHRCDPVSLDVPFAGKDPQVRALFDALRAKVTALADVTMAVQEWGVGFIGRRRFLSAVPRRAWLELRGTMARRMDHPTVRAFTVGPTQHLNVVRVREGAELDGDVVSTLLRESVAYGSPPGAEPADRPRPDRPRDDRPRDGDARNGWEREVDESFFAGLGEE